MNSKYFVLYRCDNKPYAKLISKRTFEDKLNSGMFDGWEFISEIPLDLTQIKEKTIFIMCGAVVSK